MWIYEVKFAHFTTFLCAASIQIMECRKEENAENCNCTYPGCSRKGVCCECLHYHWSMKQLPACLFPPDVEKTYDRSIERFIEVYRERR